MVWCHTSSGWSPLLTLAVGAWNSGGGLFAHYKDMKAKETLETLQNYPVTSIFFLPDMYDGAVKEDLKSFHFPKLRVCCTGGEPIDMTAMLKWKEATGIDVIQLYGLTETVSSEYAGVSATKKH